MNIRWKYTFSKDGENEKMLEKQEYFHQGTGVLRKYARIFA